MITAITVLILSAVGGGLVGSALTSNLPKEPICNPCDDIQQNEDLEYSYEEEDNNGYDY
jgi:hypothetical protein